MTQYAEHGHLGGYIVGGDDATYCPALWTWLVEEREVRSVIDVGCGEGHALDYFRDVLGIEGNGVEGVPQGKASIITHDYTEGPLPGPTTPYVGRYDLCWSCEFVEHVEERYMTNFLETFKRAKMLLITHAEPGQPGYHHVNCKSGDYWMGVMAAIGYTLDGHLTARTRSLAPGTHYARSGLAFVASA